MQIECSRITSCQKLRGTCLCVGHLALQFTGKELMKHSFPRDLFPETLLWNSDGGFCFSTVSSKKKKKKKKETSQGSSCHRGMIWVIHVIDALEIRLASKHEPCNACNVVSN